jgi:hypothetical protein
LSGFVCGQLTPSFLTTIETTRRLSLVPVASIMEKASSIIQSFYAKYGKFQIRYSTRFVLLIGRFAIKIPIDKRGYLQGLNEVRLWEKYRSDNLAPVVWGKFGVVCQRRCAPLLVFQESLADKIKEHIPELRIEKCDLYNEMNWGEYNSRPVLLDYGNDETISQMYRHDTLAHR